MTALSGRARKVLDRFPRHLDAAVPGKLISSVTQSLVRDQDVQAADMQAIRCAHRLYEAKELLDLLLLAGLHGLRRAEMGLLFTHHGKACAALAALQANVAVDGDLTEREQLANDFLALWSLPGDEPLRLFSVDPDSDEPLNVVNAVNRMLPRAKTACRNKPLLEGVRSRIANTARIHITGNGSIEALLQGAANSLDLSMGDIQHSEDRYWHAAPVWNSIPLQQPAPAGETSDRPLAPLTEYMGIEENPHKTAERGPRPVSHGELFHFLRKGFEDALLEIRVRGIGNRTMSPMFVNRDAGHGVGIFGHVADGEEVVFTQQGRVVMDGVDVTSRAYAWQGACFASAGAERLESEVEQTSYQDFIFADAELDQQQLDADSGTSRFVEVTPAGCLDREAQLPHAGDSLPMPSISVGKTRYAFFVAQGVFSAVRNTAEEAPAESPFGDDPFASTPASVLQRMKLVTPRYAVGFADAALFADSKEEVGGAAAKLTLRWLERQAYTVKLLIPPRFRTYDDNADGLMVREAVKHSIQRFRPAGIDVQVDFVQEDWLMGEAQLPGDEAAVDAVSRIRSQTLLSSIAEDVA